MEVFAYIICLRKLFVFALQALLPLRRCPFFLNDFFGSHSPRVFPSSLSLPSEGRDGGGPAGDGGGASGQAFGARELASVSSVHSWTGDPGVALLRWTPATCFVPVGSSSSSLHARRGVGEGESSGVFLCSRLPLPPHRCTLGKVVGWVGLPSAAPVRVLSGLPIFGLGGREGTLSLLLVDWLSCAVLLLTLSLRLPCSVQRSGRCGRGLSCLLFSLVRSLCNRWRSTDR